MRVKKILVIDDDKNCCRLIKRFLELRGEFEVLTTTQGNEGIKMAKIQKPDLILLDIIMPGVGGTIVAETLSEDPATMSIPIVFVTGIVKKLELDKSNGVVGGRHFIAKPVDIEKLANKIHSILSRN